MSVNEKIMNRVHKLLKLGTNNPNEHEAQNALLFAQKLMAENNISLSDLDILDAPKKKEVGEAGSEWMKQQWYHLAIANVIANNFRCYSFRYVGGGGKTKMSFMGLKSDCELAKTMYEFALLAIEYNAETYIKEQREIRYIRDSRGIKTDYMKGFIKGLSEKFKKQVEEMSFALVLVKDDALVKAYEARDMRKGSGSKGGRKAAGDADAYSAGKETGLKFEAAVGYIK